MTTPTTVSVRLQLRADTAANWTSANPTLLANELGRETDTGKIKIGDGSTAWSSLAYQAWATLPIAVASGGTGQTSYTNGQLLIGNTTGNTLTKATLTAGSGIAITNGTGSITVAASGISDAQIAADAEIAVSKLADGTARQLLQTDAAGTGVEWASNIDIPGTLDVTSAATFDSTIGASAGTASLPSITFTGDLNTGIYSPGADQVAISTGGSGRLRVSSTGTVEIVGAGTIGSTQAVSFNGSAPVNSMVLDSSGRLGIGVSAPANRIQVNEGNNTAYSSANTLAGGVIAYFKNTSTTDATDATIRLEATGSGNIAATSISAVHTGAGTSALTFGTRNAGLDVIERFRITGAGNVGIGTTSPGYLLTVSGGATSFAANQYVRFGAGLFASGDGSTDNYLFTGTNGLNIRNATDTSTLVKVDNSGRLLVGTSSSLSNALEGGVQIVGTAADAYLTLTRFGGAAASAPAGIVLGRSRSGIKGTNTAVSDGDFLGVVEFTGADGGTNYRSAAQIAAYVDGAVSGGGAADMPGRLVFSTTADGASSPTERMRIDSTGLITAGSGSTNGMQALLLNSGQVNTGGGLFTLRTVNDLNGGYFQAMRNAANSIIGTISQSGTTGVAYNTSSDYRLKENISAVTDGITRLQQLKPSRFTFIADPDHTVDGFIAHEVQTVVPEAITGEKDAVDDDGNPIYQGIDQSKLVPLLTAALQEAVAKIESLEARLTAAGI